MSNNKISDVGINIAEKATVSKHGRIQKVKASCYYTSCYQRDKIKFRKI